MELEDLVNGIPGFSKWTDADKIRFFAWFIHSKRGRERFTSADIRVCYDQLRLDKPKDVNSYLAKMVSRKPSEALRNSQGYTLEKRVRDELEKKYGQRPAAIQVDKLLMELLSKVPNLAERTFLDEALICYRCKAFRAAIVMAWNLAYDHLCYYVLNKHLTAFNVQWPKSYQKKHADARIKAITVRDDFGELQESDLIQICRSANIITNDIYKILNEKLGKRNTYAHPSSVTATPHAAEEVINELVTNVVLKLV